MYGSLDDPSPYVTCNGCGRWVFRTFQKGLCPDCLARDTLEAAVTQKAFDVAYDSWHTPSGLYFTRAEVLGGLGE